jgi:hypothetical protein
MKLPVRNNMPLMGLTGVVLIPLLATGYLEHWTWIVLCVFLIVTGIGQQQSN